MLDVSESDTTHPLLVIDMLTTYNLFRNMVITQLPNIDTGIHLVIFRHLVDVFIINTTACDNERDAPEMHNVNDVMDTLLYLLDKEVVTASLLGGIDQLTRVVEGLVSIGEELRLHKLVPGDDYNNREWTDVLGRTLLIHVIRDV